MTIKKKILSFKNKKRNTRINKSLKDNPRKNTVKINFLKNKKKKKSKRQIGAGLFDLLRVKEYKQQLDDQNKGIYKPDSDYYNDGEKISDKNNNIYEGGDNTGVKLSDFITGNNGGNDNKMSFYNSIDTEDKIKTVINNIGNYSINVWKIPEQPKPDVNTDDKKPIGLTYNPNDSNIIASENMLKNRSNVLNCFLQILLMWCSSLTGNILFFNDLNEDKVKQLVNQTGIKDILPTRLQVFKGRVDNITNNNINGENNDKNFTPTGCYIIVFVDNSGDIVNYNSFISTVNVASMNQDKKIPEWIESISKEINVNYEGFTKQGAIFVDNIETNPLNTGISELENKNGTKYTVSSFTKIYDASSSSSPSSETPNTYRPVDGSNASSSSSPSAMTPSEEYTPEEVEAKEKKEVEKVASKIMPDRKEGRLAGGSIPSDISFKGLYFDNPYTYSQ